MAKHAREAKTMELHEALAHISVIREQMARTEMFRGYRALTVGFSAVMAAAAATLQAVWVTDPLSQGSAYLAIWITTAAICAAVCACEVYRRYRRSPSATARQLTSLAVGQFLPCVAAGALLTVAVFRYAPNEIWLLPSLWAILFGLGMFASFRFLPRCVFWVAAYYLVCGVLCITLPPSRAMSPWTMFGMFGVGQSVTALLLYWNLERNNGQQA